MRSAGVHSVRVLFAGIAFGLAVSLAVVACVRPGPSPRTAEEGDRPEPPETVVRDRPTPPPAAAPPARHPRSPLPETPDASPAASLDAAASESLFRFASGAEDAASRTPGEPIRLRVGLATDVDEVPVPCCRQELVLGSGRRRWAVRSPLRVLPDPGSARRGHFRLQVAALKDESQARELAARLGARSGYPADFHFDAGVDLYRVRLGRFPTRADAEAARRRLQVVGVTEAWIVGEGGGISDPAFLVVGAGRGREAPDAVRLPGRWLAIAAAAVETEEDGPVEGSLQAPVQATAQTTVPGLLRGLGRFRGRWLLYLNDRGKINLINEVELEDYLRSVVPSEMGPELYDRLEALKAQAVAARTYTLRNVGEFHSEGYDICATPRCQVYRGVAAEHPLSDRAVAETARQVLLYDGRLIDARYSATCGGHTENVQVIFPLERAPYLRAVPCPEAGSRTLTGTVPAGTPFPQGVLDPRSATQDRPSPRGRLEQRLRRLARLAELPAAHGRLRSLERREIRRFVGTLFDLILDPRLLTGVDRVEALVAEPPVGWTERDRRRAERLLHSGLLDPTPRDLEPTELGRLPFTLARALELVREEVVHHLARTDDRLRVRRAGGEEVTLRLPEHFGTYQRRGEEAVAAELHLVPGDRLRLVRRTGNAARDATPEEAEGGAEGGDGVLLAVLQEVEPVEASYRLRSPYASWRRYKSDEELSRRVAARYPGFDFRGLEVLSRGVSGRVARIRLLGGEDRAVEVTGLAVRWTLDVPDNRFTVRRTRGRDGRSGWLFTGSGWGHGVGLCQIGSVNLAGRGAGYREILHHYYTGVEAARVVGATDRFAFPDTIPPESASEAARTSSDVR